MDPIGDNTKNIDLLNNPKTDQIPPIEVSNHVDTHMSHTNNEPLSMDIKTDSKDILQCGVDNSSDINSTQDIITNGANDKKSVYEDNQRWLNNTNSHAENNNSVAHDPFLNNFELSSSGSAIVESSTSPNYFKELPSNENENKDDLVHLSLDVETNLNLIKNKENTDQSSIDSNLLGSMNNNIRTKLPSDCDPLQPEMHDASTTEVTPLSPHEGASDPFDTYGASDMSNKSSVSCDPNIRICDVGMHKEVISNIHSSYDHEINGQTVIKNNFVNSAFENENNINNFDVGQNMSSQSSIHCDKNKSIDDSNTNKEVFSNVHSSYEHEDVDQNVLKNNFVNSSFENENNMNITNDYNVEVDYNQQNIHCISNSAFDTDYNQQNIHSISNSTFDTDSNQQNIHCISNSTFDTDYNQQNIHCISNSYKNEKSDNVNLHTKEQNVEVDQNKKNIDAFDIDYNQQNIHSISNSYTNQKSDNVSIHTKAVNNIKPSKDNKEDNLDEHIYLSTDSGVHSMPKDMYNTQNDSLIDIEVSDSLWSVSKDLEDNAVNRQISACSDVPESPIINFEDGMSDIGKLEELRSLTPNSDNTFNSSGSVPHVEIGSRVHLSSDDEFKIIEASMGLNLSTNENEEAEFDTICESETTDETAESDSFDKDYDTVVTNLSNLRFLSDKKSPQKSESKKIPKTIDAIQNSSAQKIPCAKKSGNRNVSIGDTVEKTTNGKSTRKQNMGRSKSVNARMPSQDSTKIPSPKKENASTKKTPTRPMSASFTPLELNKKTQRG